MAVVSDITYVDRPSNAFPSSNHDTEPEYLDDRIPVWPPDISAILYGRVSTTDWNAPWHDVQHIVTRFSITPSLEYGVCDPLHELHKLSLLYNTLSDGKVTDSQKRAENVVHQMVTQSGGAAAWTELPLGIAAPLREAARTCQLAPPGNWPLDAYRLIGRNDLATSATVNPDAFISKGYKSKKEYIVSPPISLRQALFSKFLLRILQSLNKRSERLPQNLGRWRMKQRRRLAWISI